VVLAAAAWPVDQQISSTVAIKDPKGWGELLFSLPVAVGFYVIMLAILASFPNRRRLIAGFLAAVLLSALLTQGLKIVIGRARPELGLGPRTFQPFDWAGPFHSFPSGDASAAMTLALLLGLYFPRARWVFYFYAGWIGIGRVLHSRHFPSDVLIGWVIGALAVYVCLRLLGPRFYSPFDQSPATGVSAR